MHGPKPVAAGEPVPRMNGAKALVVGTEVSALRPLHGLTITNVTGPHYGITLANTTDVVLKNISPGIARPPPPAATANSQPIPAAVSELLAVNNPTAAANVQPTAVPVFGIVNVTGTGLEGAVTIPAPVDPPPGNATGRGPGGPGAVVLPEPAAVVVAVDAAASLVARPELHPLVRRPQRHRQPPPGRELASDSWRRAPRRQRARARVPFARRRAVVRTGHA